MILSDVSIRRPVLATVMTATLLIFGLVSYRGLPLDALPDVDLPFVSVKVTLEGASPEEMEREVTRPLEEAVNTISGVKELRSRSTEETSQLFVEFHLEKDVDVAAQEVRDRISEILDDLPEEIDPPVVEKLDPDAEPILTLALSGSLPIDVLSDDIADDLVKTRLERLPGVGAVRIVGGQKREISVWLDKQAMIGRSLTGQQVFEAIRRAHIERPAGRATGPEVEYLVRTMGELSLPERFHQVVVARRQGRPIYLREVGYVEDGLEEPRTLARFNGRRVVALLVRRQSGTNTVQVIDAVKRELPRIARELPGGVELGVVRDQSRYIRESTSDVLDAIFLGGLFTVVVIFLFLRNFRSTLINAVAIPASLIATFTLFRPLGFTLNYMTLLALSLSVGLVVDDAIVVLECTYRHLEEGEDPREAAHQATREVGMAATVATVSIAVVFLPVAFMKGLMGRWFFSFGVTVALAVLVSLFVAFTAIPMLSALFLRHQTRPGLLYRLLEGAFARVERAYGRLLRAALAHRWLIVLLALGIFAFSLHLMGRVGSEFYTYSDHGEFNVRVELPRGFSLERVGEALRPLEEELVALPHVEKALTAVGGGTRQSITDATIYVGLVDKSRRELTQFDLMARARELADRFPDLKLTVEQILPYEAGGGESRAPVQFLLKGAEIARLRDYSQATMERMRAIPGLVDVDSNYEGGKPELRIEIHRPKAAELGLDVEGLSSTVQMLIGGKVAAHYQEGDDRYDIRVRYIESDRSNFYDLLTLPLGTNRGGLTFLAHLATVERVSGPTEINRQNRQRAIAIAANLEGGKTLGAAVRDVEGIVAALNLPPGYGVEFSGDVRDMQESAEQMLYAISLAVIFIYLALAAQFESFVHPFTLMLSLPLSLVGAFGALYLLGSTINIFSLIGLAMLMGLVIKNAILLIDYTNLLRERGLERKAALLKAGPVRLRPILMTAISTIVGMVPVAFSLGAGAEERAPMAISVMGGMTTSTLLTLVVVPVVYDLLDDLVPLLRRLGRPAGPAGPRGRWRQGW